MTSKQTSSGSSDEPPLGFRKTLKQAPLNIETLHNKMGKKGCKVLPTKICNPCGNTNPLAPLRPMCPPPPCCPAMFCPPACPPPFGCYPPVPSCYPPPCGPPCMPFPGMPACSPCPPPPCGPCVPCPPQYNPCNPCNPYNPCNPCAPNPCNPCAPNPCNPCAPNPCNPCNPCAPNPCNPCFKPCNPCKPPCGPRPCNPCCKPRCCPGGGTTLVKMPRGAKPGMNGPATGGGGGNMQASVSDKPASYNNCNFYVSEMPKGMMPGMANRMGSAPNSGGSPVPGSPAQEGKGAEDDCCYDPCCDPCYDPCNPCCFNPYANVCKNTAAGDCKPIPPPVGYPGSERKPWGNDEEPIGGQSGGQKKPEAGSPPDKPRTVGTQPSRNLFYDSYSYDSESVGSGSPVATAKSHAGYNGTPGKMQQSAQSRYRTAATATPTTAYTQTRPQTIDFGAGTSSSLLSQRSPTRLPTNPISTQSFQKPVSQVPSSSRPGLSVGEGPSRSKVSPYATQASSGTRMPQAASSIKVPPQSSVGVGGGQQPSRSQVSPYATQASSIRGPPQSTYPSRSQLATANMGQQTSTYSMRSPQAHQASSYAPVSHESVQQLRQPPSRWDPSAQSQPSSHYTTSGTQPSQSRAWGPSGASTTSRPTSQAATATSQRYQDQPMNAGTSVTPQISRYHSVSTLSRTVPAQPQQTRSNWPPSSYQQSTLPISSNKFQMQLPQSAGALPRSRLPSPQPSRPASTSRLPSPAPSYRQQPLSQSQQRYPVQQTSGHAPRAIRSAPLPDRNQNYLPQRDVLADKPYARRPDYCIPDKAPFFDIQGVRETMASILRKRPPAICKWHDRYAIPFPDFCLPPWSKKGHKQHHENNIAAPAEYTGGAGPFYAPKGRGTKRRLNE